MLRRRRRNQRGATAVEFALVSIPFFTLVIGMVEYGWYFYVSQSSGSAASMVARRLSVGDCWGAGEALAAVKEQAPMVTTVTTSPADLSTIGVGSQFSVTVDADGSIINFLPVPNGGAIEKTVYASLEDATPGAACP